jgi:energy-coupling factor transporter ATP-binding protein EcfA2
MTTQQKLKDNIATLKVVLENKDKKLTNQQVAEEVAWMMVGLKMSREVNKKSHDNLVDAAGYLGVVEKVQNGQ